MGSRDFRSGYRQRIEDLLEETRHTLYGTRAKSWLPEIRAEPAATIFPSVWRATAFARSKLPAKSVVIFPSPSKVRSREPSGLYRASAKSKVPETKARLGQR